MEFSDYIKAHPLIKVSEETNRALEYLMFEESYLIEAFDYKTALGKLGLKSHKTGPGLIGMIAAAGKHMAQLFYQAIVTAKSRTPENKEKLVKLLKDTRITKEQIIDFLLDLDMVTLHLVSGPIHIIEAVTGWHIWANVKTKIKGGIEKVKAVVKELKNVAKHSVLSIKNKIMMYVRHLESLIKMEIEDNKI